MRSRSLRRGRAVRGAPRALEEESEPDPTTPQSSGWRQVLARVHEHRGELAEAEQLAREAVAFSQRTDSLDEQCLALWDLAEVLAAAQRPDEAADALEQGA